MTSFVKRDNCRKMNRKAVSEQEQFTLRGDAKDVIANSSLTNCGDREHKSHVIISKLRTIELNITVTYIQHA